MQKVAPLIIFEWIQFSERTIAVKALLAKQNGEVMAKMSLLSAPGSVLIKQRLWSHQQTRCGAAQTVFLSKQVRTIAAGRQSDAQTIKVLEPIHF